MTPDLPLPSGGGTWMRDPETGALTPLEAPGAASPAGAVAAAAATTPAPAAPSPARGRKSTEQEA